MKAAMNRTVISIDTRDVIPLTSGAHAKDDAIHDPPPIDPFAPCMFWRIRCVQQRFDALPQFIGHFPQGGQAWFAFCHARPLIASWEQLSYQIVF